MADEHVTERPQDPLPGKDSDKFADELTASQLNRTHDMPSGTPEEVAVPNIALEVIRPPSNLRSIQFALSFLILSMSCLTFGLGVDIQDRLIFGFLLVCIGGAVLALCISIAFSVARLFHTTKHPNMPQAPRPQPPDPCGGEVGTE